MLDRRRFLALAACTLAMPVRAEKAAAKKRVVVTIQPLAPVPSKAQLAWVQKCILAYFDVDIVVAEVEPLPESAFFAPKKRHRAEKILAVLEPRTRVNKTMGFTAGDISTTIRDVPDKGILGLGNVGGSACVVSPRRARTRAQLGQVAVHELGHTFGSDHCETKGCLMHDLKGRLKTLDHERFFCADTLALFRQGGVPFIENPTPPWK